MKPRGIAVLPLHPSIFLSFPLSGIPMAGGAKGGLEATTQGRWYDWAALNLLARWQRWSELRKRKDAAIQRALVAFRASRGETPIGGHVLRSDARESIVRITYITEHIPPGRAWFAVSRDSDEVRELMFEDVRDIESPWR